MAQHRGIDADVGTADASPALDPGVHQALTDLCAYALALDAERERAAERAEQISAALEALRTIIGELQATPVDATQMSPPRTARTAA